MNYSRILLINQIGGKHDFSDIEAIKEKVNSTIGYIKQTEPITEDSEIYYPGEQSALRRQENIKNGIPVNEKIWDRILEL